MIMVQISDGGDPAEVPLVYYDERGARHVIGKAAVQLKNGEVIALGQITEHIQGDWPIDGVNLESFSVGPFSAATSVASPAEEASRRLGKLHVNVGDAKFITESNPDGQFEQCLRRDLHGPHEWAEYPDSIFRVYCPGKSLT
jgi:hypothetical protein